MFSKVSRRGFLASSALLAVVAPLAAACSSATPSSAPTQAPAAQNPAPTSAAVKAPSAQPSGATPAPAATTAPASAEKVSLQIYTSTGGQWKGWMDQAYKDDVDGFRTKHPNITPVVNGVPGWTDAYFPKIFTLVSTGAHFDVLWYPPRHRSHIAWAVRYHIMRSLNDLMKADQYDPAQNFLKGALESSSWDGQLYWFSYTGEPSVPVIAYNKTQIEKMGLSVPPEETGMTGNWTFDDMAEWAQAATKDGFWGFSRGNEGTQPIGSTPEMRQFGIDLVDPTGKKVEFPKEQFTSWLQYRWNLYWKWKVSPKSGTDEGKLFTDGKLLACPGWPVTLDLWPKVLVKDKFEIAFRLTPVVKKGDKRRTMLNEHVNGVAESRFCLHPQEAFEYLKWISGKEFAIQGIASGLGAPIARQDFWEDPRLYKISPNHMLLKDLMLNIEPDFLVANWRGDQFETVFGNAYQKLELNTVTVDQAATQIPKDCQALLDQPEA